MSQTLYTAGYMSIRLPVLLLNKAKKLNAIVTDIRFSPRSHNPAWARASLEKVLEARYVWVEHLGNENFKGGPIKLHNTEAGVRMIVALLARQPVILLCACENVTRCHRSLASKLIADECGAKVCHLSADDFRR